MRKILSKLDKVKYPLLVLAIGVVLMLLPGGGSKEAAETDPDALLREVLSCSEGVGDTRVIVSGNGVVVVCEGAENAKVRLDIIRAVGSYTGFGSDRITVLKMAT